MGNVQSDDRIQGQVVWEAIGCGGEKLPIEPVMLPLRISK